MKFPLPLALLTLALQSLQLPAQEKVPTKDDGNTNVQLADYPRPMLMRPDWINLNGEWEFALAPKDSISAAPEKWLGKTSIPIASEQPPPPELDASKRIWYRRQFKAPTIKEGHRLLLHCNGVASEALVMVNGTLLNLRTGANSPFHTDITDILTKAPSQEIAIAAWSADPKSQATGITREVWLEQVPRSRISSLKINSDPDSGKVTLHTKIWGQANFRTLEVRVLDGEKEIATGSAFYHYKKGGYEVEFTIPNPKHWSPESPKLYGLRIRLANEDKTTHDDITSYFALRKISNLTENKNTRLALNGKATFLLAIDEPTNNAALSDKEIRSKLESIKAKGYNTIHKPSGMDSPRLYHWADRVGMLIWQDLPAVSDAQKKQKAHQQTLTNLTDRYSLHPSIAIWPSSYFTPAESTYTAGTTEAKMITSQAAPKPNVATSANHIVGDPTTNKQDVEKLKEQGFSAVIFTDKVSK